MTTFQFQVQKPHQFIPFRYDSSAAPSAHLDLGTTQSAVSATRRTRKRGLEEFLAGCAKEHIEEQRTAYQVTGESGAHQDTTTLIASSIPEYSRSRVSSEKLELTKTGTAEPESSRSRDTKAMSEPATHTVKIASSLAPASPVSCGDTVLVHLESGQQVNQDLYTNQDEQVDWLLLDEPDGFANNDVEDSAYPTPSTGGYDYEASIKSRASLIDNDGAVTHDLTCDREPSKSHSPELESNGGADSAGDARNNQGGDSDSDSSMKETGGTRLGKAGPSIDTLINSHVATLFSRAGVSFTTQFKCLSSTSFAIIFEASACRAQPQVSEEIIRQPTLGTKRRRFTKEEYDLSFVLKERDGGALRWPDITENFNKATKGPYRNQGTLQVRYSKNKLHR